METKMHKISWYIFMHIQSHLSYLIYFKILFNSILFIIKYWFDSILVEFNQKFKSKDPV